MKNINTQTTPDAEELEFIAEFEAELKTANTLEVLYAIERNYGALHREDTGRLWVDRALNDIGLSVMQQIEFYCSYETCLSQHEALDENSEEWRSSLVAMSQYVFDTLLSRVSTVDEYVELLLSCEREGLRYKALFEKVLSLELDHKHICEIMEGPERNMLTDRNDRDIIRRLFTLLDEKES